MISFLKNIRFIRTYSINLYKYMENKPVMELKNKIIASESKLDVINSNL